MAAQLLFDRLEVTSRAGQFEPVENLQSGKEE
jgi:hypothetical protein